MKAFIIGSIVTLVWLCSLLGVYVFGFGMGEEYILYYQLDSLKMNGRIIPPEEITET